MKLARVLVSLGLLALSASPLAAQAGNLDPGFGVGGKLQVDFALSTDIAYAVALQPDGKIITVGTTYQNNDYSDEDFCVLRLNPNGTPDATFGDNGRVTTDFPGLAAVASSVVVQPGGKIVVAGGAFPLFTFLGDFVVARYNPDGSPDGTFGNGGVVVTSFPNQGSYAFDVLLQPDGKIVAAGTHFVDFSSSQSSNTDFALVRYDAQGDLDTGFGAGGAVTTDFEGFNDDAFQVLLLPDGKLLAVGSALDLTDYYDFALARYLPDGTPDLGFGAGGEVHTDFGNSDFDRARAAVLQPDGKVVTAGFTIYDGGLTQNFALLRYDAAGVPDPTFSGDGFQEVDFGSFLQAAYDVLLQPDGKLVVTGWPDTESSDSDFLLARLTTGGQLDTTFSGDGKVRTSFGNLNGGAYDAVLQPDGRIVAAGFNANFNQFGVEIAVARYLGDAADGWVPQGGALAGTLGAPVLDGTGDLTFGTSGSIDLSNALRNAPALLFLATASQPAPFKGGTLVAFPPLAQFFATTSGSGTLQLPYSVPGGIPSGTQVWLQWAIQDAGAVKGVALSNAILGVAP